MCSSRIVHLHVMLIRNQMVFQELNGNVTSPSQLVQSPLSATLNNKNFQSSGGIISNRAPKLRSFEPIMDKISPDRGSPPKTVTH